MSAEAIAAALVGIALLWMVMQPIVLPDDHAAFVVDPPDPEETPRGQALLALKEIEFDRATGKLSDSDYAMLHAKYSAAAVAVLDVEAASSAEWSRSDRIEALVASRTMATDPSSGGFCPRCGVGLLPSAAFCARCGAPAVR